MLFFIKITVNVDVDAAVFPRLAFDLIPLSRLHERQPHPIFGRFSLKSKFLYYSKLYVFV